MTFKDCLGYDVLENSEERQKVHFIEPIGTGPLLVRANGPIHDEAYLMPGGLGFVKAFPGCPVHSHNIDRIVAKAMKGGIREGLVEVETHFYIKTTDCTCDLTDVDDEWSLWNK